MRRDERGFALVAIMLVLALLGVVGAEFAYSMRLEASAVRAFKEGIAAVHLAEAAIEEGIRELAADSAYATLPEDGLLTFYTRDRAQVPRRPRGKVPLGIGHFSYRLTDEEARLHINTATPDRLDRLLQALGVDKSHRDTIVDSILDWIDANDEHRLNGAESDDHYLKLPVPYRARNGRLESINELLQIKGVTPELFRGGAGGPALADFVTVRGQGLVNINTAGDVVLRALGLADAEIAQIEQARRETPYTAVPGQFGGRRFQTTTRTYRIEGEGLIEGRVRARVTAIVQKRQDSAAAAITVIEWSGSR